MKLKKHLRNVINNHAFLKVMFDDGLKLFNQCYMSVFVSKCVVGKFLSEEKGDWIKDKLTVC